MSAKNFFGDKSIEVAFIFTLRASAHTSVFVCPGDKPNVCACMLVFVCASMQTFAMTD